MLVWWNALHNDMDNIEHWLSFELDFESWNSIMQLLFFAWNCLLLFLIQLCLWSWPSFCYVEFFITTYCVKKYVGCPRLGPKRVFFKNKRTLRTKLWPMNRWQWLQFNPHKWCKAITKACIFVHGKYFDCPFFLTFSSLEKQLSWSRLDYTKLETFPMLWRNVILLYFSFRY